MRVAACLLLLLTLPACDEVSDAVDNAACQASGYADTGTVRATVDGDSFSGSCVSVETQGTTLTIAGADNVVSRNSQEIIAITFPTREIRSYDLVNDLVGATYAARTEDADDQDREVYGAVDGTVRLDAVSETTASGTFSFTAQNLDGETVEVSGGRFDVTF